jgi:hypothetical protein
LFDRSILSLRPALIGSYWHCPIDHCGGGLISHERLYQKRRAEANKYKQKEKEMSESSANSSSTQSKEDEYYQVKAKATLQASVVKQAKKDGLAADVIAAELEKLTQLRQQLNVLAGLVETQEQAQQAFNRKAFDEMILRKMYVVPSFEIHNGPAGLFDYGPASCALKANVLSLWRQHFVLEENMLELECTCLTPSSVLETSGHVERFTDFMVRDVKSGECFRADKLLEDVIDNFLRAHPNMPPDEQEEHRVIQVRKLLCSCQHVALLCKNSCCDDSF